MYIYAIFAAVIAIIILVLIYKKIYPSYKILSAVIAIIVTVLFIVIVSNLLPADVSWIYH